jgi:hypothetical protein
MKTFPKCQKLQRRACAALRNLALTNVIGKANIIESGGIEVLLDAIHNHLGSAILCTNACLALVNIAKRGSMEHTGLLITMGAGAAVAKVRTKWPDNNDVQTEVRGLANLIAVELNARVDGVEKLIQDLAHSDSSKVDAALDTLNLDLDEDEMAGEIIATAGGCFALVHLMQNCLDKAMARVPACDQVADLNELAELTTLHKTLNIIVDLTYHQHESRVYIPTIGGMESVVKVMKTFPKCQVLQVRACNALLDLTYSNVIGKKKIIESGGIEVLLDAVNNHLNSDVACEFACSALVNFAIGSKENTGLLITLGGAAAVAKVRTDCSGDVKAWVDADEMKNRAKDRHLSYEVPIAKVTVSDHFVSSLLRPWLWQ